jgi:hypothetical protein
MGKLQLSLMVFGLGLATAAGNGAEDAPWQRMLKGDDARRAEALERRIEELQAGGQFAEAVQPAREVLTLRERVQGARHWQTVNARRQVETLKHIAGQPAEARRQMALAGQRLAEAEQLHQKGRYAQAEPLLRQALAARRRVLGEGHTDTALTLSNLASNLDQQGQHAQAEPLHRQALAARRKALGEGHPDTAASLSNLAGNLDYQGQHAQAEPLFRQALAIRRRVLGEEHPHTAETLNTLALHLDAQGKHTQAEPLWRAAVASFEAARLRISPTGSDRSPFTARNAPWPGLTACLARLGHPADAWRYGEAGLARGLLDDLAARAALPLSPPERQRQQARSGRLEQLDRLLIPLLTAREPADADKPRQAALTQERSALHADLAREAADLSRRAVYPLERVQEQLPADAALVFWVDLASTPHAVDLRGDHWACVVRRSGSPA